MAVKIVKKTAKVEDVTKLEQGQIVETDTIDEFARLSRKLAAKEEKIAPLKKSVAEMEKGILGAVDAVVAPHVGIDLQGEENELKLGPKGKRAEVTDIELVFDMLGKELFLKLAKIGITDLKAYLTPDQVEAVTASEFKTKRRVKVEAI